MIKIINKRFFIFIFISFIYAYLLGGNLPYSIFYTLLCIISLSYIYILIIQKNLRVDIKFNKDTFYTFEDVEVTTVIRNYSILPIHYIEIYNETLYKLDKTYSGYVFNLGIDSNKRLNKKVKFFTRGIYDFGQVNLYFRDFFSIFNCKKVIKKQNIIKVYPKIYNINKFQLYGEDLLNSISKQKGNIKEDYSISDIRKYRSGDDIRKIHWKISAKYGELYTKNFDMVNGEKTTIFLNMNKEDYFSEKGKEKEEELIDLACSLMNIARIKRIKNSLHICNYERKSFYISKINDFKEIMEYFLMNKSNGREDFSKFILENLNKVQKNSLVIIITPKIDMKIKNNLICIKKLGYKVLAFYSINNSECIQNISHLKSMDIMCISFNEAIH